MYAGQIQDTVEKQYGEWASPPPATEEERCQNAIREIRKAIASSDQLRKRDLLVFTQGSYRNRVNVRDDSDVDVGVLCHEVFIPDYPEGTDHGTFGNKPATYSYGQFKNELQNALVAHFGPVAVHRGNKAFDIRENAYQVEADVAPFFEHRKYWRSGTYRCGVGLRPDNGGIIRNYPEKLVSHWPDIPLHYENGVSKNRVTSRRFKGVVRILKKTRIEMDEGGVLAAKSIPGFLIECLAWNVPNSCFSPDTWKQRVGNVLLELRNGSSTEAASTTWTEVNGIKPLFDASQPWTKQQVHEFITAVWHFLGMRSS